MSDHTLVIETDETNLTRLSRLRPITEEDRADSLTWHIECSNPSGCSGWIGCDESHEIDGVSAADGPYDTICGCGSDDGRCTVPWCGSDDFVFHEVDHVWRSGHGWTVEYNACLVSDFGDIEPPDECYPLRPSRWLVAPDWDDDTCYLTVIKEASGDE